MDFPSFKAEYLSLLETGIQDLIRQHGDLLVVIDTDTTKPRIHNINSMCVLFVESEPEYIPIFVGNTTQYFCTNCSDEWGKTQDLFGEIFNGFIVFGDALKEFLGGSLSFLQYNAMMLLINTSHASITQYSHTPYILRGAHQAFAESMFELLVTFIGSIPINHEVLGKSKGALAPKEWMSIFAIDWLEKGTTSVDIPRLIALSACIPYLHSHYRGVWQFHIPNNVSQVLSDNESLFRTKEELTTHVLDAACTFVLDGMSYRDSISTALSL